MEKKEFTKESNIDNIDEILLKLKRNRETDFGTSWLK